MPPKCKSVHFTYSLKYENYQILPTKSAFSNLHLKLISAEAHCLISVCVLLLTRIHYSFIKHLPTQGSSTVILCSEEIAKAFLVNNIMVSEKIKSEVSSCIRTYYLHCCLYIYVYACVFVYLLIYIKVFISDNHFTISDMLLDTYI